MWKVVVVDVVCFLSSVCLSETVSIYMKEEVLYIFLLALILSILESNSGTQTKMVDWIKKLSLYIFFFPGRNG